MIADLKPYSQYKESGQRWLGNIPQGWESFPLCRVATLKSECSRTDLELLSVYLHRGVIRYADSAGQVHKPSTDLSKYQVVDPGDFVLNNQQAWRGSIGVSKFKGIISPAYVILKITEKINPDYANYLFRIPAMVAQYVRASRGVGDIQRNLFYPDLRNTITIIPPLAEQAAIVQFLDWANGRLERAIRTKRKVITLLTEQKQAIIHRAVTRGLDPTVPLKPTGLLWADEVPNHWLMTPNRSLFRIRKKLVGSRHKEYQVLSLTKRGVLVRDMEAGGKFSSFWERSQEVRTGDLVFCFFDVDETPRTVGLSPAFGMISPDYTVMECPDPLTASFLECFYVAMDDRKMLRPLYSGLRKRISKPQFLAEKTPIPPIEELRKILVFVKDSVVGIEKYLGVIIREIDLMQEYRTRLTSDIVTGKLDVREAAARLPDEFPTSDINDSVHELEDAESNDDEIAI